MKTVAYVIRPAEGGMLRHLIDLIRNLNRNAFLPVVISSPGNELTVPLHAVGAEIIEVEIADKPDLARDIGSIRKLSTALTALAPDIIHAHSNKAGLITQLAARRGAVNAATVISVHNYPSYADKAFFTRTVSSLAMRRVLGSADQVIAVSGDIKKHLVERENADPEKVSVIHNGIEVESFTEHARGAAGKALRDRMGIDRGAPVIGALGRLVPAKGFDVLLRAVPDLAHKFPGLRVVIAGSGPLEQTLKQEAAALGLMETVIFTGRVEDIRPYFSMFDVCVVPSISEPFGIIVLELMASGRPLVATRVGGIPEIIENRETGLLVPTGDSALLAAAIRAQLSDKKNAAAMAARALRVVQERFTIKRMVEATEQVYVKAIAGRDRS